MSSGNVGGMAGDQTRGSSDVHHRPWAPDGHDRRGV